MASVPIELPDDYREAAERRRSALGLDDVSAYVRKLIADDVQVEYNQRLAELAREGLASGDSGMTTEQLREHLLRRVEEVAGRTHREALKETA